MDRTDILFVGCSRVGKSTFAAYMSGANFKAGFKVGYTGMTDKARREKSKFFPHIYIWDLPGLDDVLLSEEAAHQISQALRNVASAGGNAKLVFVVDMISGTVKRSDMTAIDEVLQSITLPDGSAPAPNSYSVIFNRCKFLKDKQHEKGRQELELYFSDKKYNKIPTTSVVFIPWFKSLDMKSNQKARFNVCVDDISMSLREWVCLATNSIQKGFQVTDMNSCKSTHKIALEKKGKSLQSLRDEVAHMPGEELDARLSQLRKIEDNFDVARSNLVGVRDKCVAEAAALDENLQRALRKLEETRAKLGVGDTNALLTKIADTEANIKQIEKKQSASKRMLARLVGVATAIQKNVQVRMTKLVPLVCQSTLRKVADSDVMRDVTDTLKAGVEDVVETTKEAVKVGVENVAETVKDAVGDAVEDVAETMKDAVEDVVDDFGEAFVDGFEDAAESLQD